jgi:formate hydrogenlyase subunit 4
LKITAVALVLAIIDSTLAKSRFFALPDLLGMASLLALTGLALQVLLP